MKDARWVIDALTKKFKTDYDLPQDVSHAQSTEFLQGYSMAINDLTEIVMKKRKKFNVKVPAFMRKKFSY